MMLCTHCLSIHGCHCQKEKIRLPSDILDSFEDRNIDDGIDNDISEDLSDVIDDDSDDSDDNEDDEISASELYDMPIKGEYIPTFEKLGKLPRKFIMMIYGRGGRGKSSFCLKMADKTSTPKDKTLYLSIEEGNKSMGMQQKLRENNIKNPNIVISKQRNLDRILARLRTNKFVNVFVDSATYGGFEPEDLEKIYHAIPGFLLFTLHIKKDGTYKGDSGYQHLVEIEGDVFRPGVVNIYKNRANGVQCIFKFFEAKEVDDEHGLGTTRSKRKCFEIIED